MVKAHIMPCVGAKVQEAGLHPERLKWYVDIRTLYIVGKSAAGLIECLVSTDERADIVVEIVKHGRGVLDGMLHGALRSLMAQAPFDDAIDALIELYLKRRHTNPQLALSWYRHQMGAMVWHFAIQRVRKTISAVLQSIGG